VGQERDIQGEEATIQRDRKLAIRRGSRGRCVGSRKSVAKGDTTCEGEKLAGEKEPYASRN